MAVEPTDKPNHHQRRPGSTAHPWFRVTVREVAQAAGVSTATVSRAISGGKGVKHATREGVLLCGPQPGIST